MFVFNFKFSKRVAVFFAVTAIAITIICIICMTAVHNKVPESATCDEVGGYSLKAKGQNGQYMFLEQFGYTVEELVSKAEVKIPTEFNETYEKYNELQKSIGLDLSRFKGNQAQKLTYELRNAQAEYAVLLIYKDTVIGAHLTDGEYGQDNLPLI